MSAGVFACSVGALVRGSRDAGTMQNATSRERHGERERVGRLDTPKGGTGPCGRSACSAAACCASGGVGCGSQHALTRGIRIDVNNNTRHTPPVRLGGDLIGPGPMSARLSDHAR
jgi:hypothetical protein